MRAAAYARVSTERQEREQTIESQLTALRAWAEAEGHAVRAGTCSATRATAARASTGPGWTSARRRARRRGRDRRRPRAPTAWPASTPTRSCSWRSSAAPAARWSSSRAIRDDPSDQLLLQIQGAIAEYERALLGERFRRGKLQKARAGQYVGGDAPYGYRYLPRREGAPGQLVVDEAEAEVVRMLYGWLTEERMTLRRILKRLNAGPWLPRCGRRPWSPWTVHHILADPVYAGTAYANRYEYVPAASRAAAADRHARQGLPRLRPEEQWIPIAVPPLVGQETWDRAQAQLGPQRAALVPATTRSTTTCCAAC